MSLQRSLVQMIAPQSGLAPAASAEVIPANIERGYLLILNLSDEAVALGFGANDAEVGKGVVMQPFGFFEMLNGRNLDQSAINMISASGGKAVSWQEGKLTADEQ